MSYITTSRNLPNSPVAKKVLDDQYKNGWLYVDRHDHHRELRESPLANPYYVDRKNPQKAVKQYRHHLWNKIKGGDTLTLDALRSINPQTTLVCRFTFNRRSDNYADIIFKAARYVQANKQKMPLIFDEKPIKYCPDIY